MISVIIPTHNRANLIGRAIESVQNQTIEESIEIIVVSDGSTDDTKAVVSRYKSVRFIEYFPGINGNHARNVGAREAKGEYIAFLDDDDEWIQYKLEYQIKAMKLEKTGMSYTGVKIIYDNEGIAYYSRSREFGDLSKRILIDNCIGSTSTVVVKKEIFEKVGGFDEKLDALQDYDLWIRICQITKVSCVSKDLVLYHNYTNKRQISSNTDRYEKAFYILESKYKKEISELLPSEEKRRILGKISLLYNKCIRNGDRKGAKRYAAEIRAGGWIKRSIIMFVLSYIPFEIVLNIRRVFK